MNMYSECEYVCVPIVTAIQRADAGANNMCDCLYCEMVMNYSVDTSLITHVWECDMLIIEIEFSLGQ